jgi:hypothetical protein
VSFCTFGGILGVILTMVWDGVGLGPKGRGVSYEQLSRGVGVN